MATRTRRPRACTYCPEPNADVCVQVQPPAAGSAHIFAHRKCAQERGVTWWYAIVDEPTQAPR
ncbi:hypothetical protein [Streptomyces sp. NPDC098101]|uniref:hypothetical protein n=1 Tax=Streptomyces sp. NPDC098101 TaxID=3366096 RepID=UPI00381333C4